MDRTDGFVQACNPVDGGGQWCLSEDENGVVHVPDLREFATAFSKPIPPGGLSSLDNTGLSNLVSIEIARLPMPAAAPMPLPVLGGLAIVALCRRLQS